jgi:hypothetical protein
MFHCRLARDGIELAPRCVQEIEPAYKSGG